jgi:hypothetical protein
MRLSRVVILLFSTLAFLSSAIYALERIPDTSEQASRLVFNTNSPATSNNQWSDLPPPPPGYHYPHQIAHHFASKLEICIRQSSPGQGLLFHIDDHNDYEQDEGNGEQIQIDKRGMVKSFAKGWKKIPFDQRLQVFSTFTGAAMVPLYLIGSVSRGINEKA